MDWSLNQELHPSKVTQCYLKKDSIFIIKIIARLHKTVTKIISSKFEQSVHKKKYDPSEALGLSTYTSEATNSFLKIREAWLQKLEITLNYPPLAQLPSSA